MEKERCLRQMPCEKSAYVSLINQIIEDLRNSGTSALIIMILINALRKRMIDGTAFSRPFRLHMLYGRDEDWIAYVTACAVGLYTSLVETSPITELHFSWKFALMEDADYKIELFREVHQDILRILWPETTVVLNTKRSFDVKIHSEKTAGFRKLVVANLLDKKEKIGKTKINSLIVKFVCDAIDHVLSSDLEGSSIAFSRSLDENTVAEDNKFIDECIKRAQQLKSDYRCVIKTKRITFKYDCRLPYREICFRYGLEMIIMGSIIKLKFPKASFESDILSPDKNFLFRVINTQVSF